MQYTVTKDFTFGTTEYKEGDVFEAGTNVTEEGLAEITGLVQEGTFEPVINEDDYEEVTVDQAWIDANPEVAEKGDIKVGDTVKQPKLAEETEEERVARETAEQEKNATAAEVNEPVLMFNGKKVITDTTREVNGIIYHHVRLEDGSASDMLDTEYEAMVKDAK